MDSFHKYDINLNKLYENLYNLSQSNVQYYALLDGFRKGLKTKYPNIDQTDVFLDMDSELADVFTPFAHTIAFLRASEIKLFLDYHFSNYPKKKVFIKFVKNWVFEVIKCAEWIPEIVEIQVAEWVREQSKKTDSAVKKKPVSNTKIRLGISEDRVKRFLLQLTVIKHKGLPILTQEDVDKIMYLFFGFGETCDEECILFNCNMIETLNFFYIIYKTDNGNSRDGTSSQYCTLISKYVKGTNDSYKDIQGKWSRNPNYKYRLESL